MTVETVRGPVELDTLGRALMHEHLFIADQEGLANFNNAWGAPIWDGADGLAPDPHGVEPVTVP